MPVPLRAAVTLGHSNQGKELQRLLPLFPSTVEVSPVRLHLEDMPLLVPQFLPGSARAANSFAPRRPCGCSCGFRGGQLGAGHQMLGEVVKHRRTGSSSPKTSPRRTR